MVENRYITFNKSISCDQICHEVGGLIEEWQKNNPNSFNPTIQISICNISHTINNLPKIEQDPK